MPEETNLYLGVEDGKRRIQANLSGERFQSFRANPHLTYHFLITEDGRKPWNRILEDDHSSYIGLQGSRWFFFLVVIGKNLMQLIS